MPKTGPAYPASANMAGETRCSVQHRLCQQQLLCTHCMPGPAAGWALHKASKRQAKACSLFSEATSPAMSWGQESAWEEGPACVPDTRHYFYFLVNSQKSHCPQRVGGVLRTTLYTLTPITAGSCLHTRLWYGHSGWRGWVVGSSEMSSSSVPISAKIPTLRVGMTT